MVGFVVSGFAILLQVSAAGLAFTSNPVPPADSARLVRSVRSAQRSFEAFRRGRLPFGYDFSGPCDVRVGRYCYWRGDDSEDEPPRESPDVARRRDELIRQIGDAAATLPADGWLAGQRVRYLVEAGRADSAMKVAASECRADPWWCAALAGYAAHSAARFADADSAYAAALAAMAPDTRCEWLDISRLVDDVTDRRLRSLDCAGRVALAERIFRLSAPLYFVSATDLLSEHLARVTRAVIAEQAATPDGEPWANDERELVIRYGWPQWYSRSLPSAALDARPSITGHDSGMPYDFLVAGQALDRVAHISSRDWTLDDDRAATEYAPRYARSVHELPNQLAVFRRGDSAVVVAAWDARRDTTLLGRPLIAALALFDETRVSVVARDDSARAVGRLWGAAPIDSGVVSLELLAQADRRAARYRVGLLPPAAGRVALSDLLLYSAGVGSASELSEVRDSALASNVIPASRAVGVFWETYGRSATGEPVHFSLTVREVGVGWARRAAERLRLVDRASSLRIEWDEVPRQRDGIAGRGVRVDFSRLRHGHYVMDLVASTRTGASAVSTKEIDVR